MLAIVLIFLCDSAYVSGQRFFNGFRDFYTEPTALKSAYDFIIIGAGSGGSVAANRLSENPDWSVLLLEAGRDEIFLTDVPLMAAIQTITSYNWGYKSERLQTACLGLIGGKCNMPRGKGLGGTSVINFMLYTRGNKRDFDEWEKLGNTGWGYRDVLKYFIKSENCTLCSRVEESYHGYDGYLNVEHAGYETPMVQLFIEAGKTLGYSYADPNGSSELGFSKVLATLKKGTRCSASKAFLRPVRNRNNLHISINSIVVRIIIDHTTKRTIGVEFIKNKIRYKIKAKKEVILSAGALNSPHILMHSGIGPKEELERWKIPVIQHLKVGYNLQDHMAFSTLAFLVNETVTVSDRRVQNIGDILDYLGRGEGPFTIPGGAEALAFIRTKYADKRRDYPDIELVLGCGALNGDVYGSMRSLLGIPASFYEDVYGGIIGKPAFSIAPVLMRPKSKGRVMLKHANPLHWPLLRPNYFEDESDIRTMVEGIKMAISVAESEPFRKFNATLLEVSFPGCRHYPFRSDEYWSCTVRYYATTLGHQVGTCKMGPSTDPEAVVDSELRVYGIDGLRVIDGSIMPNIVAGHTNAVIFMIGEKASDLIKKTWSL